MEETEDSKSRAGRALAVLLWVWLALAAFFAALSGMAADGCADSTCDSRVQAAWLVLLAVQTGVVLVGLVVGSRLAARARLGLLVGLAVVSPVTIVVFFSYIDRYV